MRLVILEAESLGKDMDLSGFSRFGEVTVYEKTTEEECPERVREADIVICNKVRMCSRTLSGAENLKLICVTATGINNIDLDYVKRHNIAVTNVAGYSTVSVAQHTFAMYFYLAEKLRYYDDYVKNGSYAASSLFTCMDRPFTELEGKTWGIIGLGAIGALIANAAVSLGMNVCGYDPYLSVDAAWRLSRDVKHEVNLDGIYAKADYISINVPYTDQTFHMLDARAFSKMKDGVRIINESRAEIVDDDAMLAAIASGRVGKYVTDFPNEKVVGVDNIIALPHLGACTPESEEKSAVMAARELYDYLANGNIKNSVNFPDATLERMGVSRVCILHQNVPTMLNQFLEITCSTGLNVENMINKAYGAYAYAMIDLNGRLDDDQVAKIDRIPEVIRVRVV